MPRSETIIVVFVASPDDLEEERNKLEDVLRELNATWARNQGVRLELVKWETDAYPGIGKHPQDVVNEQIGRDYDIFIGLMWSKFGTPTDRAGSGTEEEFNRARDRHKANSDVRIMFYFKEASVSPMVDLSQLAKVQEFRSSIGNKGVLYWTFQNTEDFVGLVRMHLAKQLQSFEKRVSPKEAGSETKELVESTVAEDAGILDLMDLFTERFAVVQEITERIAEATQDLGSKMRTRTTEITDASTAAGGTLAPSEASKLVNRAADDMEQFVTRAGAELPIFRKALREAVNALGGAAVLAVDLDRKGLSRVREGREAVTRVESALQSAEKPTEEFRDTVRALPRMTTRLNKAKRSVVEILDDLIGAMRDARRDAEEGGKLIDAILENKDQA